MKDQWGHGDPEEFLLFNLGSLLVNIRYPQESFAFWGSSGIANLRKSAREGIFNSS